jgi:hypothetical protein
MCFSAQAQLGGVHIGPAQAEQLAASHTGLERSNDEILQVGLRMEPQTGFLVVVRFSTTRRAARKGSRWAVMIALIAIPPKG